MSIVLWAQEAVLLMLGLYWTVWDRYMQVLYLGRALRTKEILPDFLKRCRVTRHPLVFRGLTGSQRTPGFWGVTSNSAHYVKRGCHFFFKLITFKLVHSYNVKHLTCTIFCSSGLQNIYKLHIWKCLTFTIFTLFTKTKHIQY